MSVQGRKNHWDKHAGQWGKLSSPLRPCGEDLDIFRAAVQSDDSLSLILGVTPEFYEISRRIVAIDHNAAMINKVWPGNCPDKSAVQGNWLQFPFLPGTFDTIIGDGGFTLFSWPLPYENIFAQLKMVLKPEGKLLLRFFLAPDRPEPIETVCRDALAGRIGNFHSFKWRFAMAMVGELSAPNIPVGEIHRRFQTLLPDRERLARQTSWKPEEIDTIDAYRDSAAVYSFPTLAQLRESFNSSFRERGIGNGMYELADRCPILILETLS